MSKVKISEENILNAHKQGCKDVKHTLENMFPDVFKKQEKFYNFRDNWHHGEKTIFSGNVFVGDSSAKSGDTDQVILWSKDEYDIEVYEDYRFGYGAVKFRIKK